MSVEHWKELKGKAGREECVQGKVIMQQTGPWRNKEYISVLCGFGEFLRHADLMLCVCKCEHRSLIGFFTFATPSSDLVHCVLGFILFVAIEQNF